MEEKIVKNEQVEILKELDLFVDKVVGYEREKPRLIKGEIK